MYKLLRKRIEILFHIQVAATGIGLFRILYGLITLQEIVFLFYFRHLIFDPIPYIDVEFPLIPFFLCLWGLFALFLTFGYRYQLAAYSNYLFWIIFVNFTPMQRDFDGGFDPFMIGVGFFLLFMPGEKAFSIDNLRKRLKLPFNQQTTYPETVTILAYYIPIIICLGFLYFDSAIHKLFAPHWMNGLGSWLPATQPYYVSAIDMSVFLNNEYFQKFIGYLIILFQFSFPFFFNQKRLKIIYLIIGFSLHLGITLTLNIYPFGLGMLSFYTLLIPSSWWTSLSKYLTERTASLIVFFDDQCPLCNKTVTIINHFDIFKCIEFKSAQSHAINFPEIANLPQHQLLKDLYSLEIKTGNVYSGIRTYIKIFITMRYLAPLGVILYCPGIFQLARKKYRHIADSRARKTCDNTSCLILTAPIKFNTLYQSFFEDCTPSSFRINKSRLTKILILISALQLNSTIHYGIFYRLNIQTNNPLIYGLSQASNSILLLSQAFIGIVPHALYLHDHFAGYDHILAITYTHNDSEHQYWLPFINQEGRLLAPNWGRVHSMWANIAVTPTLDRTRLDKFLMKTTAFWGANENLDLNQVTFHILIKHISAPNSWIYDLRKHNMTAPWTEIGSVNWTNNHCSINLPSDIDKF
ncbi:MAG: DCC1-like thiol-disulfide oxidoreductase family protein [Methylococcaceae bacterium]|jgi:predicted DCC family thiol-disulfide oxidoreductase YuxK